MKTHLWRDFDIAWRSDKEDSYGDSHDNGRNQKRNKETCAHIKFLFGYPCVYLCMTILSRMLERGKLSYAQACMYHWLLRTVLLWNCWGNAVQGDYSQYTERYHSTQVDGPVEIIEKPEMNADVVFARFPWDFAGFEMIFLWSLIVGVEALAGPSPSLVSDLTNRTIGDSTNTIGVRFRRSRTRVGG